MSGGGPRTVPRVPGGGCDDAGRCARGSATAQPCGRQETGDWSTATGRMTSHQSGFAVCSTGTSDSVRTPPSSQNTPVAPEVPATTAASPGMLT